MLYSAPPHASPTASSSSSSSYVIPRDCFRKDFTSAWLTHLESTSKNASESSKSKGFFLVLLWSSSSSESNHSALKETKWHHSFLGWNYKIMFGWIMVIMNDQRTQLCPALGGSGGGDWPWMLTFHCGPFLCQNHVLYPKQAAYQEEKIICHFPGEGKGTLSVQCTEMRAHMLETVGAHSTNWRTGRVSTLGMRGLVSLSCTSMEAPCDPLCVLFNSQK